MSVGDPLQAEVQVAAEVRGRPGRRCDRHLRSARQSEVPPRHSRPRAGGCAGAPWTAGPPPAPRARPVPRPPCPRRVPVLGQDLAARGRRPWRWPRTAASPNVPDWLADSQTIWFSSARAWSNRSNRRVHRSWARSAARLVRLAGQADTHDHDLGPVQGQRPRRLGESLVVADHHAQPADRGVERRETARPAGSWRPRRAAGAPCGGCRARRRPVTHTDAVVQAAPSAARSSRR